MINNIRKFVGNATKEEMFKNHMMCSAIVTQLTAIGEISKKINPEIKNLIALPWHEIIGFRNRAIHEYSHIDNNIVVGTVFGELEDVENRIKEYLAT